MSPCNPLRNRRYSVLTFQFSGFSDPNAYLSRATLGLGAVNAANSGPYDVTSSVKNVSLLTNKKSCVLCSVALAPRTLGPGTPVNFTAMPRMSGTLSGRSAMLPLLARSHTGKEEPDSNTPWRNREATLGYCNKQKTKTKKARVNNGERRTATKHKHQTLAPRTALYSPRMQPWSLPCWPRRTRPSEDWPDMRVRR